MGCRDVDESVFLVSAAAVQAALAGSHAMGEIAGLR